MKPAQRYMLFGEWKQAREWLIEHGRTPAEADAMRATITTRALGYAKSMSDWRTWRNDEVTKVKAAFIAVYDGGNFDAQMDAQEDPRRQAGRAEAQLRNLVEELYPHVAGEDSQFKWENIIRSQVSKICKKRLDQCTAAEIFRVIGTFKAQQKRNQRKAAEAIAAAHAAGEKPSEGDPF
jgi:hypothetical protein